jgi:hypothetical protein
MDVDSDPLEMAREFARHVRGKPLAERASTLRLYAEALHEAINMIGSLQRAYDSTLAAERDAFDDGDQGEEDLSVTKRLLEARSSVRVVAMAVIAAHKVPIGLGKIASVLNRLGKQRVDINRIRTALWPERHKQVLVVDDRGCYAFRHAGAVKEFLDQEVSKLAPVPAPAPAPQRPSIVVQGSNKLATILETAKARHLLNKKEESQ